MAAKGPMRAAHIKNHSDIRANSIIIIPKKWIILLVMKTAWAKGCRFGIAGMG